jgi:hypothetical protein
MIVLLILLLVVAMQWLEGGDDYYYYHRRRRGEGFRKFSKTLLLAGFWREATAALGVSYLLGEVLV